MKRVELGVMGLCGAALLVAGLAGCLRRAPRVPDVLPKLHHACDTRADCAEGQQCIRWQYGVEADKVRATCEVPCEVKAKVATCPSGMQCKVATDYGYGPPPVCFGLGYDEWPY